MNTHYIDFVANSIDRDTRLLVAAAAVLVSLCIVKWWRNSVSRPFPGTRHPPCLFSLPIIGSLSLITQDINDLPRHLTAEAKKHGNVFGVYLGSRYTVVLTGIETIKQALVKKSTHFADRPKFFVETYAYNPHRKGIGFVPYGPEYRRNRQTYLSIMKEFGFGKNLMESRINFEINEFIENARRLGGRPFDPSETIHISVVNVIMSIVLGKRYPFEHPYIIKLRQLIVDSFEGLSLRAEILAPLRFIPPYSWHVQKTLAKRRQLPDFIRKEIGDILTSIDANNGEHDDSLLTRYIEVSTPGGKPSSYAEADIDREELAFTVKSLLGAGDDTTSTTLGLAILELANHRDIQVRLQAEVDDVIGSNRQPSLVNEPDMPYTQAFILETLRRHTVVPLSLIRQTTCDTQVGEIFVPANTLVISNLYSAHMDPAKWKDPTVFNPERFLNESGKIVNKDNIAPFALGSRSCIGEMLARQELFLFLAGIVQNFDIRPPEGQESIAFTARSDIILHFSPYQCRLIDRRH